MSSRSFPVNQCEECGVDCGNVGLRLCADCYDQSLRLHPEDEADDEEENVA